jgi:hypothetical protein
LFTEKYRLKHFKYHLQWALRILLCILSIQVFEIGPVFAREPVGLKNLEHFERLPYFKDGIKCWQTSSQSRAGTDDYIESYGRREHILLDVKGPGCIYRMFFTEKETHGRIKIFVDSQSSPVIDKGYYPFINNLTFPFVVPLVGNYKLSSGGYYSYLPIPFKKSCRVVAQGILPMFFFNITYHTFTTDEGIETFDLGMSGDKTERLYRTKEIWQAVGSQPYKYPSEKIIERTIRLNPGEKGRLLGLSGSGAITSLKLDISPPNKEILDDCRLKMSWDNESSPSVDVPLGHFFGSGLGEVDFKSLPIGMSKTGMYYCYFPMPYWRSAKISIQNNSTKKIDQLKYEIRYTSKPYEKDRAGYFKAFYNKEHPTTPGKDHTILKTQGRGHYVGVILTAGGKGMKAWEGDERIYIDNSATPQLHGTGAEDYFNGAWYFNKGMFTLPTHGYTARIKEKQANNKNLLFLNCYRLHLSDYIPFYSSIKVGIEHGNGNRVPGFYSSVAYYYAVNTPKLILTDEFDVGKTSSERQHNFITEDYKNLGNIKSHYDGEKVRKLVADEGIEISKYSQFRASIIPNNEGIRLRRRIFHGKSSQEARVRVNGKLIGNWYTSPNPLKSRWMDTEFEIPAKYTVGKKLITIKIEPVSDSNSKQKWNEFYYWIYTYRSKSLIK